MNTMTGSFEPMALTRSTVAHHAWKCRGCWHDLTLIPGDVRLGSGRAPRCPRCDQYMTPVNPDRVPVMQWRIDESKHFTFRLQRDGQSKLFAIDHGLVTAEYELMVRGVTGQLPMGLDKHADYWPIVIDPDNFRLATSKQNALDGVHVVITTPGTGYLLIGHRYARP